MRISIEGNIASGKSTLLQSLAADGWTVYPEPVSEWSEWLKLFYKDPKRWAFGFQMKVLSSFAQEYEKTCVIERSMMAGRHVFGQLLFNQSLLTDKEWDLFKTVASMFWWEPTAIIYVDTPPEVCLERIGQRGREAEAGVGIDYLRKIAFMYCQMLKYYTGRVVRVDGTQGRDDLLESVREAIRTLNDT